MQLVPGPSRGYSGKGMALTTHPALAPRRTKEESRTSAPTQNHHGMLRGELYLYGSTWHLTGGNEEKYEQPRPEQADTDSWI